MFRAMSYMYIYFDEANNTDSNCLQAFFIWSQTGSIYCTTSQEYSCTSCIYRAPHIPLFSALHC
jgi:hypothetical protein